MTLNLLPRRAVVTLLALCFSLGLTAQQTISGTLTDADSGDPLIGASILVKGTSSGTVTDFDGRFNLQAEKGQTLIVTYTGYAAQEIEVGDDLTVDVQLTSGELLDEVVVVAYGKQKKVTVTGAVVALDGEELELSPAVNLTTSLAGRTPGVVVIQPSGEPGADDANIRIRGTNTLGNSSPLIVIDGIPDRAGGLARLSPEDIASMSVLKDASAAIYGARAANGVILVTTKRGSSGRPSVSYDYNYGWSQPTLLPEMSSAVEYANIMNELNIYPNVPVDEWQAASTAIRTQGVYTSPTDGIGVVNAQFSPEAIRLHGEGSDPWGYPDTDWFDDTFKTWSPQTKHHFQIDGGSETFRYLASAGYLDQDAFYRNSATSYQQYNLRVNLDADISDYITTSLGVVVRREERNFPTESANSIFRMLMRGRPTEPAVWPNGRPGPDIENGQNPYVITTNATGYTRIPTDYLQTNGSITFTNPWVEGLGVTLSGAIDQSRSKNTTWRTPWELYTWDRTSFEDDGVTPRLESAVRSNFKDPRLRESNDETLNINLSANVTYDKSLAGGHNLGFLAGVTRETFTGSNSFAFRRNFISPTVDQLFAGGSLQQETGGSGYERARLGYYGRAQYNYEEKYLAEFIFRYDGSYIFPEDQRYGFFPGVLLGWNVTNEDFFNVKAIDYLKVRASYGQMGNDQVFFNNQLQEFAYLSSYSFGEYPINSIVETTLRETLLANPNFTWERANNFNVGLDATLFSNRVDLNLEYFYNRRSQILIQETGSTPASSGINSLLPPVNAGQVDNRGFEFAVAYNAPTTSAIRWRAGVNAGYAQNEVVFQDEIPGAPDYQLQEGRPIGGYLVYESDGAFIDQAAIEAEPLDYSAVTNQLLPGDMRFKDINGDGVIDADDRTRLNDNGTPTFNFGGNFSIAYGNFDLNVLFQGATGASIRVQTESGDIGNYLKWSHDNRWSIDDPSSEHPRLASRGNTYYTGGNYGNNTYFLFNKNYVRLKNLEIGYTLPTSLTSRFRIKGLRAYANGLNLATISANDIFDPEATASTGVYYPQNRLVNLGVNLTF